jgi:hypothetical protein
VYNEASELGLFVTENVVDLQSKDNQLSETEKMAVCQYHCKAKGVSPDLYASLSFTKANHMFFLLVNNSFDVFPMVVKICSLWLLI